MLKVENLYSGYKEHKIISNVSFSINESEIVLLRGPNGSGKSTLLKTIYGIIPSWHGKVLFENKFISEVKNKGIIYIPQKNKLFDDLTSNENLQVAGVFLDKKTLKNRIETISFLFGDKLHLDKKPFNLSGGERQILSIAMSMINNPKLFLIDEPFSGLSDENTIFISQIFNYLKNSGKSILLIDHKLEGIVISDRVIELNLGEIESISNSTVFLEQLTNIQNYV